MKKIYLSMLLLTLSISAFSQALRESAITDELSNPEIDNLSGAKPDDTHLSNNGAAVINITIGSIEQFDQSNHDVDQGVEKNNASSIRLSSENISVYPNPAQNFVIVKLDTYVDGTISILNLLGQVVMTHSISGIETQLDIKNLNEGIYFISIQSHTDTVVKKIKILN